ncbi:MAG: hypothetical protein EA412_01015 [Chitinophagaceae bacterium]|nr:MAG: hypothetical protein EA412_01015 [Chitinophagaceae bacterium]
MNKILEFIKSNHFMLRQWDRKIEDKILYKILPHAKSTNYEKEVVIVKPNFLKKLNLIKDNHSLVLIKKKRLLLTIFWCKNYSCYLNKDKDTYYQELDHKSLKK